MPLGACQVWTPFDALADSVRSPLGRVIRRF
jgi:hypothetical protein